MKKSSADLKLQILNPASDTGAFPSSESVQIPQERAFKPRILDAVALNIKNYEHHHHAAFPDCIFFTYFPKINT